MSEGIFRTPEEIKESIRKAEEKSKEDRKEKENKSLPPVPHITFPSDEYKSLVMLKADASSRYWNDKKEFVAPLLSMDLRRILHIVTLKDNPKEINIYNPETGLYEGDGYQTLRAKIAFILGNACSEYHARAVIYNITAKTLIKREDFTVSIQFVPFKNGILDISKNPVKLINYSKKFYFTKKLPTTYNPEVKSFSSF